MGGADLAGYYLYDDQGVKARRVDVVQNGVLKTFLMSRTPIQGIPQSNGHGRAQPGLSPVARQSNLMVEVAPSAVKPDLKKLLIEEVKKQGFPTASTSTISKADSRLPAAPSPTPSTCCR